MKKILQNRLFFSVYFLFFLLLCFTLSPMHTLAQEGTRQIKGIIFSENGAPLDGAVVQIKGAKTSGVTTNASGSFSIQVPSGNAILVFSMVGYEKKELPIGNNLQLSVQLQALNSSIGEVVVVGYGTQKKETLSGSVASIKSSEINTTKSTSVVSNIQGKIPGVHIRQQTAEPGTFNSLVSIRGFGAPLLVIDGVPRDGMSDFERLNPEDIENISVLKDAAAAIYGMNSDNGVIIVTTKRGSRGKAKFNYNGFYGTKQPTAMLKNVDAHTYRTIKNEMNANTKLASAFTQTELDKWKAGTEKGFQDYDWFKETIRPFTAQSQHNFSVSGGNDQVTYYSSLGILSDDGILKSDIQQYRKYNFRTNVTFNMSEDLKATITFAGRVDNNKSPQGSYFWFFKPLIIADRAYTPFLLDKPGLVSLIPPESTNPYALAEESISGYEKWSNVQYQTNLELSYNVRAIKGLKLGFLGAYDGNTYNWSNLQRSYYQYNYITAAPTLRGQNKLTNSITNLARTNMQVSANYKRSIATNHNIAATAVYEMRSLKTDILSATRQYDDVYTSDIINQGSLTNALNGGDRIIQRYMSTLGRLNYDFKSKYLLEMAFRNDGSFRYAPNKRWAFFPSASIGWRASEESFIKKALPFVSNLKFRGSYGLMGADAGNAFEYFSGYRFSSIDWGYVFNNNVLTMGMAPPGVVNDNLTWIKTKTANFGVDISLWQGKLNITADVFQKNRDGLLANRIQSVPNTFGASFPQENINSDKVRGFELMIGYKGKLGKLNFDVSANMTYARKYLIYSERAPYQSTWEKWKDVWGSDRILGREWGYLHDGRYTNITEYQNAPLLGGTLGNSMHLPGSRKITDVNGDGIINGNDQMPAFWSGQYQSFAGNPPLQFGMNFNFSYKSFDMNMLFQGASLFTVFASPNDVWGYGRYPNLWEKFLDRWRLEDPKMNPYDPAAKWIPGEYPALRSNFNNTTDGLTTDIWRMNATYLRLKSLEIGYTLPVKLVKKAGIQNLRMYVNGFNLFTFSNKYIKGLDPEREEGAYTADLTYPLMRSFNFGINLNF
jgi:TonB-linked SusC/RagA family outer membrane protein